MGRGRLDRPRADRVHPVEHPGTFLLLVEWDSLQAHLTFKETTAFGEFVGLVKEFFAAPPGAVHYAPLAV